MEQSALIELTSSVDRLAERLRADQDVISRMQGRIEALQGDQVRALLGPAVTELANLHASFTEAAGRDYERLGLDRVRKEFDLLTDRIESAIDLLGAVSLDARAGDPFDSRVHQAVRQVATPDARKDKTIATVVRQGFSFDPEGRPAIYARVQVFSHDPALENSTTRETAAPGDSFPDVSLETTPSFDPIPTGAPPVDDDLALPQPPISQ